MTAAYLRLAAVYPNATEFPMCICAPGEIDVNGSPEPMCIAKVHRGEHQAKEPNFVALLNKAFDWNGRMFDYQVHGCQPTQFELEAIEIVRGLMLCVDTKARYYTEEELVHARCDGHGDGQMHAIADVNAGLVDDMIAPRLERAVADARPGPATKEPCVCEMNTELDALRRQASRDAETIRELTAFLDDFGPLQPGETKALPQRVKDELADFSMVVDHLTETYCHFSGGAVSKPGTLPRVVFDIASERESEERRSAIGEALESIPRFDPHRRRGEMVVRKAGDYVLLSDVKEELL